MGDFPLFQNLGRTVGGDAEATILDMEAQIFLLFSLATFKRRSRGTHTKLNAELTPWKHAFFSNDNRHNLEFSRATKSVTSPSSPKKQKKLQFAFGFNQALLQFQNGWSRAPPVGATFEFFFETKNLTHGSPASVDRPYYLSILRNNITWRGLIIIIISKWGDIHTRRPLKDLEDNLGKLGWSDIWNTVYLP